MAAIKPIFWVPVLVHISFWFYFYFSFWFGPISLVHLCDCINHLGGCCRQCLTLHKVLFFLYLIEVVLLDILTIRMRNKWLHCFIIKVEFFKLLKNKFPHTFSKKKLCTYLLDMVWEKQCNLQSVFRCCPVRKHYQQKLNIFEFDFDYQWLSHKLFECKHSKDRKSPTIHDRKVFLKILNNNTIKNRLFFHGNV